METSGFLLYAAALPLALPGACPEHRSGRHRHPRLRLASLAQRHLTPRTLAVVLVSGFGLLLLGVSLAGDSGDGGRGSTSAICSASGSLRPLGWSF